MKRASRWRWAAVIFGAGAALVGVRWWLGATWQRITISKATTHIVSPLAADGMVDYVAAINARYGEGVTRENNAAIVLLLLRGHEGLGDFYAEKLATTMGVPELFPRDPMALQFEGYPRHKERLAGGKLDDDALSAADDEVAELARAPWQGKPEVSRWLESAGEVIKQVEVASRLPRYFVPVIRRSETTSLFEAMIGPVSTVRNLGEALTVRAMGKLGAATSDVTGAREDAQTLLRMGFLMSQQPTLLERSVAMSTIRSGLSIYRAILETTAVSPADADVMRRELAAFAEMPAFAECLDVNERYTALDMVTRVARYGPEQDFSSGTPPRPGAFSFGLLPVHFDPVLREANGRFDQLVKAASIDDIEQRDRELASVASAATSAVGGGTSSQTALRRIAVIFVTGDMASRFRARDMARQEYQLILAGLDAAGLEKVDGEVIRQWVGGRPRDLFWKLPPDAVIEQEATERWLRITTKAPLPTKRPTTGVSWLDAIPQKQTEDFQVRVRLRRGVAP